MNLKEIREIAKEKGVKAGKLKKDENGVRDPKRVEQAGDNAVVGNAEDVAAQIRERFHPEDRLMLWFDFFNHDSARVIANMEAFMAAVAPRVRKAVGA